MQLLEIVVKVATKKGINMKNPITDGWFRRFKAKIPQATLCRGDWDANVCANCSNREMTYRNYFEVLKKVLDKHDLTDKPGQIYNCNETGIVFATHPLSVVTSKKEKKVRSRTPGNKVKTVLAYTNAVGQAISPMVIKNLQQELTEGEVPGMLYGLSEKGWIDADLFNPLTMNDDCSCHRNLAACYQLAQFILKIGSALAERVGQGEWVSTLLWLTVHSGCCSWL